MSAGIRVQKPNSNLEINSFFQLPYPLSFPVYILYHFCPISYLLSFLSSCVSYLLSPFFLPSPLLSFLSILLSISPSFLSYFLSHPLSILLSISPPLSSISPACSQHSEIYDRLDFQNMKQISPQICLKIGKDRLYLVISTKI